MLTSDEADYRLRRWAAWEVRGKSGGLGFPRRCAFLRTVPAGLPADVEVFDFCDAEELETDRVVSSLSVDRRRLIRKAYFSPDPVEAKAKALRISRQRYYELLKETLELVAYRLSRGAK